MRPSVNAEGRFLIAIFNCHYNYFLLEKHYKGMLI